jgi:hypothetical protein
MNSKGVFGNRQRWVEQPKGRANAKPGRLNERENEPHSSRSVDPKMKLPVGSERLPVVASRIVPGHALQRPLQHLGVLVRQMRCGKFRRHRLKRMPDAINFLELLG